ncbi:MAG: hypothetical protein EBR82_29070 [Caulobacteraceae bacterium]|nr:hypothetical protein [Caulobacteraceae bacterium]
MQKEALDEYRVSQRVVLRRGDRFRVSGGPYWKTDDGRRLPLAARGVCTFVRATKCGSRVYIEARNKDGAVLLHVEGRRKNKAAPEIVCRPYKIRGKIRSKKR